MAIFRNFNDLVLSFLEYLRLTQPELDTKPGTVSRDVFIDAPSQQIANLYTELRSVANMQSLLAVNSRDLDRLASNYGATRSSGTPSSGVAVFTTNNLDVDILIPQNSVIIALNGSSFQTTVNATMSASSSNVFRATATRLRSELDLAGITDEFAIEVVVEAQAPGTSGNIGRFSLVTQNISGISNVTNLQSFSGGTDTESDVAFRTRVLSIFAGSNTGTALGYQTAISTVPGVEDSLVIVPGDPLLIRDGTQVVTNSNGELIVSEPGTGGKVDIYVLGTSVQSQIDSFIYSDQSGRDDPTDPSNDFILGQRGEDSTLNTAQRRVELIASGLLPLQPVEGILSVAGSSSGTNFVEKFTDSDGNVKGNYELVKDEGDFGGSPFGFDKLHWISDTVELDDEEINKGLFNGSDALNFTDVLSIRNITRDELVTNENSTTSSTNRNTVILKHTPIRSVSRIVNLTNGERYVVSDQNPDGTGDLNTTGKILITGNTLPVGTDILQVDYIWVKPFDRVFDFDNLADYNAFRTVQDSVDWSFGNLVANEPSTVVDDGYGVLTITVTHPIFKVLSANTFLTDVSTVNNGVVSANETVTNILDIRRVSDGAELFNTDSRTGTLSGTSAIIFPTDSLAEDGDIVSIRFNTVDIFSPDGYDSSTFATNIITLPPDFVIENGTEVLVSYIADVSVLLPITNLTSLPATKNGNKFLLGTTTIGEQPTSNIIEDNSIIQNLRRASSHLRVTMDNIQNNGSVTVSGTTITLVEDTLIVVTSGSGFELDLQQAIKTKLGVSKIPSTVSISKLVKVERVNLDINNKVESIDNVYDIINYTLYDNSFDLDRALEDEGLSATKVVLPHTTNNTSALLTTGDIVRVTFYFKNSADNESLYFSRNGTQITNKLFSSVSRISIGSGFQNAAGIIDGTILVENYNQPISNNSYEVDYNYIGPKENERITITFTNNEIISLATTVVEDTRPITADVLIKAARAKDVDVTIRIVLLPEFTSQEQTVIQDAIDSVTGFLNSNSLGTTVDQSDIINNLYSVSGIDRVQIINFSTGTSGNLLSITAERNEYLRAGTVSVSTEER